MSSKVLVADDSAFARRTLRRVIEERGFECIDARDGEEALAEWREHRPALVLLDLNMPKTTGYQVLESMKKEGSESVVIVVSADVQPKARERVAALGARAMVRKPLDKEKVEAILALVEQQMATLGPDTSNAAQPALSIETLDQEQLDTLAEIVNVGMGQAAATLAELLAVFLEISVPISQSLEEYLQAQHRSGCAETALLVQQAFTGDLRGEAIAVFDEKQMDELPVFLRRAVTNRAITSWCSRCPTSSSAPRLPRSALSSRRRFASDGHVTGSRECGPRTSLPASRGPFPRHHHHRLQRGGPAVQRHATHRASGARAQAITPRAPSSAPTSFGG